MPDTVIFSPAFRFSAEERNQLLAFVEEIHERYGPDWGIVIDLRDNFAQVLRCIFTATGPTRLIPISSLPLQENLTWRSEAIQHEKPLYFAELPEEDPKSLYLILSAQAKQLGLFPIIADATIGLVTLFCPDSRSKSIQADIASIQQRCQKLAPLIHRLIWQLEQSQLDAATQFYRDRETPHAVAEFFHRILQRPVLLLQKKPHQSSRIVAASDTDETRPQLLGMALGEQNFPSNLTDWTECQRFAFPSDKYELLAKGKDPIEPEVQAKLAHFLTQTENLLLQPAYKLSSLTFLNFLQHWLRSGQWDIQDIFQHIIDTLVPFLDAHFGTLALLDREKLNLIFVSQAGPLYNPLKAIPILNAEGQPTSILAHVASNNVSYLAPDVSKDPYYHAFDSSIASEMCAPIRVRGEVIGLFSVSSPAVGHFGEAELRKLEFFANQIGVALFQAGIIDRVLVESERGRKSTQDFAFGFSLKTHAKDIPYNFGNLVGQPTGPMAKVYEAISRINGSSRDDLNVLISGETGCGKEMVAFALHNSSNRGQRPMVVANFASYGGDPNLIQSELFGHERGSFSGASARRIGCIEQAHQTTLLIDEIGDIVPSVQIKLLRILQQGSEKRFMRLGGQEEISSNVRILAATHKNLWKEVESGRFREDLFYRLNTLVVHIPPLRERVEDIPLLAQHFTANYERAVEGMHVMWSEGAINLLKDYYWPGNVRQLEAVINRALVLYADQGFISSSAIDNSLSHEQKSDYRRPISLYEQVKTLGANAFWELVHKPYRNHELTKDQLIGLINESLADAKGSYKQAAALLGVETPDYHRFLDFLKNNNAKPDFREYREQGE